MNIALERLARQLDLDAPRNETLRLASVPGGLQAFITPRLRQPSRWMPREETDHVVVRPPAQPDRRHSSPAH